MTPDPAPETAEKPTAPAFTEAQREEIRRLLEHRFRHILRSGQVSPLFHLMMRYKLGTLP